MKWMTIALFTLFSAILTLSSVNALGRTQSAGARAELECDGKPAENVLIRLYDEDTTDLDDKMAEFITGANGTFEVVGKETELTQIDPKVNIYHSCGYNGPCKRKLVIYLPEDYIYEGETPTRVFDIGHLNLNAKFAGESKDCFH